MQKQELRQLIRQRKRQQTQQQLSRLSLAVSAQLLAHQRMQQAHTVMLYYSLPDEADTRTLIDTLCQQGKRVLLPVVTGEGQMELRHYSGRSDLRPGAYGIMEPAGELFARYDEIDLAVIPGMAFDTLGHRLGRGKGYYDRFLPRLPHCYKIGICYPFQLLPHVPTCPTDIAVDEVLCGHRLA